VGRWIGEEVEEGRKKAVGDRGEARRDK